MVAFWWFSCCVVVGFACLPSIVAFDCRSLLPWVELEFRWCVVLGFGCDLFCGLGFGYDFEIFYNKICLDAEKM